MTWGFSAVTVPETRSDEMTGSKKVDLTLMASSVWTRSDAVLPVLEVVTTLRMA